MKITSTTQLTAAQLTAALALQQRVHAHDHTFKNIYMSNQLNAQPTMATFFMATIDHQLVGFLMNYADEGPDEAAEFSVIVDPAWRQRGIATALVAAARAELARFGYGKYDFVSERAFLTAHPDFLTQAHLVTEAETDFQMSCPAGTNADYVLPAGMVLREMAAADLPALTALQVAAFNESNTEGTRHYLEATLTDPSLRQYVLVDAAGTIVATSAVDLGPVYDLFSLAVLVARQGQGNGTKLIQAIMADLARRDPRPLQLAVAQDNAVARHVYGKAGFKVETELVYLTPAQQ